MQDALLQLLRCPESGQSLRLMDRIELEKLNTRIEVGSLLNSSGHRISTPLENALIREDHRIAYPICNGIPILMVEEAIATALPPPL